MSAATSKFADEFRLSGYARNKLPFTLVAMRWRCKKFHSTEFAQGLEVLQPLGWPRGAALRRADLVVDPRRDTVQHLISEQKIRQQRVRRLPCGLDPEFEAKLQTPVITSRPTTFPERARIILTVGHWDPAERYKGADTLISAMPRILQSVPDALLVLVGEGKEPSRLEFPVQASSVAICKSCYAIPNHKKALAFWSVKPPPEPPSGRPSSSLWSGRLLASLKS